ncbi:MAG: NMD3-related protein [Candidatus Hodarchaeota archaeon]
MPNRFCAICGKSLNEDSPHFGMCLECYLKENPLFELPKTLPVNICIDCGSYSKKDVWIEPINDDLPSVLHEIIQKFLLKSLLKNKQVEILFSTNEDTIVYSSTGLIKSVIVLVMGRLKESAKIHHQQEVKLILNHMLCKNCSNLRGGTFFISIVQLRVKDQSQLELIEKVLVEIDKYVVNIFDKDHRHYISKIEDQKYGVDLYLSTNELMNHIIKFLKSKYHFLLKRSKKLVGRDNQKGKNIYRLKALIKFLPIAQNDTILIDNQDFIVENITRNKIILKGKNNIKLIKDYSYFFNENIAKKK